MAKPQRFILEFQRKYQSADAVDIDNNNVQ
jgi:hypothetical protein